MNLPLFIAGRYLFAKKSHNVINVISAISAIGMAVGTAVLIIILSVYNGFDDLIRKAVDDIGPDFQITPEKGKVFDPSSIDFSWLEDNPAVASVDGILQDEVFISYEGRQGLAYAKGVSGSYIDNELISKHVINGEFILSYGDIPYCAVGSALAYQMEINPRFLAPVEIFYPERGRNISLSNPAASLNKVSVHPSCTFSVSSDIDASLIILPIGSMRNLLGYETEVSALEVRLDGKCTPGQTRRLRKELESRFGSGYIVKDRFSQNEALYKMMRYEKISIFLILIFIIIIIAFNIFGSLSMLIIEKTEDISTLKSLGATEKLIRRVFVLEGWLISLLGLAAGLVAGVVLALLQQRFGFVRLPGNYLISAYPVVIKAGDIIVTALGVALIGYFIALLPTRSLPQAQE